MDFENTGAGSAGNNKDSTRYTSRNRGESWRERQAREKESLRKKYAENFASRPLHAFTVSPEMYTEEMKVADREYVKNWKEYHFGKNAWLLEELRDQRDQRLDLAKGQEERTKVYDWYYAENRNLFDEQSAIWSQEAEWLRKIRSVGENDSAWEASRAAYEELIREAQERMWKAYEEAQRAQQGAGTAGAEEQGTNTNQSQPHQPETSFEGEGTAEVVAMQELGISASEFGSLFVASDFSEGQLVSLAERILGVPDGRNATEVKNAFRRRASEWHPDKSDGMDKVVNEVKFKVINAFYNTKYRVYFRDRV